MTRRIGLAAALVFLSAGFAHAGPFAPQLKPAEQSIFEHVEGCGYYAIFACAKSYKGASRTRSRTGGYVADTDDYDNFRNNWYCVVKGPFNKKRKAKRKARRGGGYVKYSCFHG